VSTSVWARFVSKVRGENFKFNTKFAFEDLIFVVGSAANSVGRTLEIATFCRGPYANIAELVPSVFFPVRNYGFCGGLNTFSEEKHQHVHVDHHLVTEKGISC